MLFTCAQYFSNTRSSFYVQTIVFIRPMQTAMKGLYQAGIALGPISIPRVMHGEIMRVFVLSFVFVFIGVSSMLELTIKCFSIRTLNIKHVHKIPFIRIMCGFSGLNTLYQDYVWFQWVKYPLSGLRVVLVGSIFSFLCNDL